jgi:hypothetical protein
MNTKILLRKCYWNRVLGIVRQRREDNVEVEPREMGCYSENALKSLRTVDTDGS